MSIIVGKNGELINTSNVGSQFIPEISQNIGALANVARPGGSTIPRGVKNEDGTITIPTIQMKSRSTGLGRGQLQNVYGLRGRDDNDAGYSQFQFLVPEQTGTMTYDPEEDSLTSDTSLANMPTTLPGTGGRGPSSDPAYDLDLKRMGEKSAGAFAANIGATLGNAYVGANIPGSDLYGASDVLDAGVGSILPFGNTSDVETAGLNYMKYKNNISGDTTTFSDRIPGGSKFTAGLQGAAFVAGANFLGQIAAGADAMDAAKDAGKSALAYTIGYAVAGPTGGKVLSFIAGLFGPKGSSAPAPVAVEEVEPETQSASKFDKYGLPIQDGVT